MARIDPTTQLFHDLTKEEADILFRYGQDLMLRGIVAPTPQVIEAWYQACGYENSSQRLQVVFTVLPSRIFYSLLDNSFKLN